eukprot:TRINITY_DN4553_c0_g1_i1.p1 TRINITY_DN4553_c0_g1~~TRINITY_DN4553_c0_g1_i1.p1  ORF type:complete len:280 (+),score=58.88 TRINITY_DN4553_c0_g1_i1:118-957(+)
MKKLPSLPSNYVTLQQLQEKQIKEQRQKQKEIEDEGKKLQKFLQSVESKSTDRPLREHRRNGLKRQQEKEKVAEQKIEENIVEGVAEIGENDLDKKKQVGEWKKKRKKGKKKRNPEANENLVGDRVESLLGSGEKEKIPKASPTKPTGNEIQIRLWSKRENGPAKREPKQPNPQANRTAEIAGKIRDLTIDDGEGLKTNGGRKRNGGSTAENTYDSWRFGFSRGKPKSTDMVWVRKEDIPPADNISTGSRLTPAVFTGRADNISAGSRVAPPVFTGRRR